MSVMARFVIPPVRCGRAYSIRQPMLLGLFIFLCRFLLYSLSLSLSPRYRYRDKIEEAKRIGYVRVNDLVVGKGTVCCHHGLSTLPLFRI